MNKEIARVDNALANNKKQMKNTEGNITDQKKQVDKLEIVRFWFKKSGGVIKYLSLPIKR
ncbi:hypothetical protein ABRT01_07165 [Lentibacillus sp. L22]